MEADTVVGVLGVLVVVWIPLFWSVKDWGIELIVDGIFFGVGGFTSSSVWLKLGKDDALEKLLLLMTIGELLPFPEVESFNVLVGDGFLRFNVPFGEGFVFLKFRVLLGDGLVDFKFKVLFGDGFLMCRVEFGDFELRPPLAVLNIGGEYCESNINGEVGGGEGDEDLQLIGVDSLDFLKISWTLGGGGGGFLSLNEPPLLFTLPLGTTPLEVEVGCLKTPLVLLGFDTNLPWLVPTVWL